MAETVRKSCPSCGKGINFTKGDDFTNCQNCGANIEVIYDSDTGEVQKMVSDS